MRYLSLGEIVDLHQALLDQTGGATGIRDLGGLESALAQPRATFDGADLHPTAVHKAAALGFSLTLNHPFVDGNKRVAHAAMEVFLLLNGRELVGTIDEQERLMLDLADGQITREELTAWLEQHTKPIAGSSAG
jgi:death-on-curing protein